MMHGFWGDGWHMRSPFGMVFMVIFWGAIIYALYAIIKGIQGKGGGNKTAPLEIIKHRYAAGEITKEEYEEAKKTLEE